MTRPIFLTIAVRCGLIGWLTMAKALEARMSDAELERSREIHELLQAKYGGGV